MIENLSRKIALIAAVLLGSAALLFFLPHPIRLGLDLAGGVRLVYKLDFEQAYRDGALDPSEPRDRVLDETIAILRKRVDPTGVREPTIRRIGQERIELCLPGTTELQGPPARAALEDAVAEVGNVPLRLTLPRGAGATPLALDAALAKFPGAGGVVQIDQEKIRYRSRQGELLVDIERGNAGTQVAAHAAGSEVVLVSDDAIHSAISNLGDMRFYIQAEREDFARLGSSVEAELESVRAWLASPENDTLKISVYNGLPRERGGPPPGIRWFTEALEDGQVFVPRAERSLLPLLENRPEWNFQGEDLAGVRSEPDPTGFPSVAFEMREAVKSDFGDFTEANIERVMAIVLNDEVVSAATINGKLPGSGIIYGRFTDRKVNELITVLRSGSLKIKPILEQEERVGATVGQEYVDKGWIMGLCAAGFVVGFMSLYFRKLGVYASIGLLCNMLIQMAALVALQATLTLPGIAGIILSIGMAVDANILIFERMREEQDKGAVPAQAAEAGFRNALSAIVDGNVTTVLAGLILYNLGTGPIRGFAVTLIIGVLTSMFAALVIVRLLIQLHVRRNPTQRFRMGRWFANANFRVLKQTRLAFGLSVRLIVVGLGWFAKLEPHEKYGIDFLGGATVKVRTEAPQHVEKLRELVAAIPGDIGESAVVFALPGSKLGEDAYTEFRISFKHREQAQRGQDGEQNFRSDIQRGLASVLQQGPIELSIQPGEASSAILGVLHLEDAHSVEDVSARLADAGLREPRVKTASGRADVFEFTAQAEPGAGELELETRLRNALQAHADSAGRSFALAEPIPETSLVGGQAVADLRDSAIKALALSIFVTVLYIRVRFLEYSYGIAAVAALLHDILLTIGVVALLVSFPFIHVEFDMPLVAVFLTIIGYSINDTIVVFDRIRENRRHMQAPLEQIVERSINETFSRTVITSTSMATILIVLLFNLGTGNVLESFSFVMAFGIFAGTFSSIFIASPIFLWLEKRQIAKRGGEQGPPALEATPTTESLVQV